MRAHGSGELLCFSALQICLLLHGAILYLLATELFPIVPNQVRFRFGLFLRFSNLRSSNSGNGLGCVSYGKKKEHHVSHLFRPKGVWLESRGWSHGSRLFFHIRVKGLPCAGKSKFSS
jgi:hypothetical protein